MIENKKVLNNIAVVIAVVAVLLLLSFKHGIKLNLTQSMPLGIYQKVFTGSYKTHDIIVFPVPQNAVTRTQFDKHPMLREPQNFLKIIYGVAGDKIKIENDFVYLSGDESSYKLKIKQESILKDGVIPDGYVFVGTPHKNSFDSRYYGLIKVSTIMGSYAPLLTI